RVLIADPVIVFLVQGVGNQATVQGIVACPPFDLFENQRRAARDAVVTAATTHHVDVEQSVGAAQAIDCAACANAGAEAQVDGNGCCTGRVVGGIEVGPIDLVGDHAAIKAVIAGIATQEVGTCATQQRVVAVTALEGVVAAPPCQDVI